MDISFAQYKEEVINNVKGERATIKLPQNVTRDCCISARL